MGRGRAKAKQTKVARDLKYRTYETDFSLLERELRTDQPAETPDDEDLSDDADRYPDEGPDDDLGRRYG